MKQLEKLSKHKDCIVFWQIMYSIALAQAIDKAPFHFNPHKLKYTHYRDLKTWKRGTRAP
jgi:hypothetical protein